MRFWFSVFLLALSTSHVKAATHVTPNTSYAGDTLYAMLFLGSSESEPDHAFRSGYCCDRDDLLKKLYSNEVALNAFRRTNNVFGICKTESEILTTTKKLNGSVGVREYRGDSLLLTFIDPWENVSWSLHYLNEWMSVFIEMHTVEIIERTNSDMETINTEMDKSALKLDDWRAELYAYSPHPQVTKKAFYTLERLERQVSDLKHQMDTLSQDSTRVREIFAPLDVLISDLNQEYRDTLSDRFKSRTATYNEMVFELEFLLCPVESVVYALVRLSQLFIKSGIGTIADQEVLEKLTLLSLEILTERLSRQSLERVYGHYVSPSRVFKEMNESDFGKVHVAYNEAFYEYRIMIDVRQRWLMEKVMIVPCSRVICLASLQPCNLK